MASALPALPAAVRPFAGAVDRRLAPGDGMYEGGEAHYLCCGASALNVILAALQLADRPPPARILDFGAGAGRVTRWLRAAFPEAAVGACDLRDADVAFCRDALGVEAWVSGTDIDALRAPGDYDLVWVGSVITHLSADDSARLIDRLLGWTRTGGLLVMSTSGRIGLDHGGGDAAAYIESAEAWTEIKARYADFGFGYADYPDTPGYGVSLTKLSWLGRLVEALPNVRAAMIGEGVWDGINDVFAVQKTAEAAADAAASAVAAMRRQASAAAEAPGWLRGALRRGR